MKLWKVLTTVLPIAIAVAGCVNKSMSQPVTDSTGGILQGKVTRGPLSPMFQPGQGAPTGGEVVDAQIDIANASGKLASSPKTDANGRFSVNLAPGAYTVTMPSLQGALFSHDLPATVTIVAGQTQRLDIHLDTGIR